MRKFDGLGLLKEAKVCWRKSETPHVPRQRRLYNDAVTFLVKENYERSSSGVPKIPSEAPMADESVPASFSMNRVESDEIVWKEVGSLWKKDKHDALYPVDKDGVRFGAKSRKPDFTPHTSCVANVEKLRGEGRSWSYVTQIVSSK